MPRPSHREKLLQVGLRVVHQHGFAGASVRDIVRAAGVPQGSFTNHFRSKEAFGLEVIALYAARSRALVERTLHDATLPPRQRLRAWLAAGRAEFGDDGVRHGCLLGNLAAEASAASEPIRLRLVQAFAELQAALAGCLRAAVAAGEIAPDTDCEALAGFIMAALQGAQLLAKAQRSALALDRFEEILFSQVLAGGAAAGPRTASADPGRPAPAALRQDLSG